MTDLEAVKGAASGAAECTHVLYILADCTIVVCPAIAPVYTFCTVWRSPIRSLEICYTETGEKFVKHTETLRHEHTGSPLDCFQKTRRHRQPWDKTTYIVR